MTLTPIERVIEVLEGAKYKRHVVPLIVAGVPFEFSAILVGADRAPDLIVIIDTVLEPELRIRQKIEGLARALDVAGSRRPLTAVLVGPKPSDTTIDVLSRVCRVLPVGTPVGENADMEIHDWLAILLPLPLPDPSKALANPIGELIAVLSADWDADLRTVVLNAAAQGSASVQLALKDQLEAALAGVAILEEEQE